jgi:thermostable 8-oxoguanine DNA glycosylase
MYSKTYFIMSRESEEIKEFEKKWTVSERIMVRGMVTKEAAEFLENEAFKDFGMMKKGAIGMELTKLILIARDCIKKQEK